MLQKIRIKGYRALKDFELDLPAGKPLVLIGENATGKTTILDAIAMLGAVANGRAGRAILDRGRWAAVGWAGTSSEIELTVRFSAATFGSAPLEYMVRLGSIRSIPTVLDEEVRTYARGLDQEPYVFLKGGANGWAINVQTTKPDPLAPAPFDASLVTSSLLATIADEARYPTPMRVKEALQAMTFYPPFALGASASSGEGMPDPIGARPVERVGRLKSSGHDLLNALHTLSQEQSREWESLLTDLRAVFPWCKSLKFPAGAGRGVHTLSWIDDRSGAKLYLDDMSEGMRVYLALLAALYAPDKPTMLAFDEPERSLHPRALRRLVKVMESRAEQVPILVATHSDRLLDYLESPTEVLRITRFSKATGVRLEQLDPSLLDAWLKDHTLSELRARDMLEAPAEGEEP